MRAYRCREGGVLADGMEDYRQWQEHDPRLAEKLNALIEECRRHPFKGIRKPEPLGGDLSGWWSRRISHEHQLVYHVTGSGKEQVLHVEQSIPLLSLLNHLVCLA